MAIELSEERKDKTVEFYGNLIMNMLTGNIPESVLRMNTMSKDEMFELLETLNDVKCFADAIWRVKGWR